LAHTNRNERYEHDGNSGLLPLCLACRREDAINQTLRQTLDQTWEKETAMKRFSILSTTSIAALSAWTFVAFATPASARTYEYCRRDVIGYTLSCGFDTLAQCQAMSSGRGGDCLRDPTLGDVRSAYAFAPKRGPANGTLGTNR
jgi:Protein of unknown function (DUF3551)